MQVLNQTTKVRLLYTSTTQSQCQEMPQLKISRHTLSQDLFHYMYLGKQSAGIWGMKCVKKCHFSMLTRGFSSFRELLKKRGVEPPIFYVHSLGRLTFDLSVTEEDPLNSICLQWYPQPPNTHFHLIKTQSYLFEKYQI